MKKVLRQFRYYGEDANSSSLNAPSNISRDSLYSGHIFRDSLELRSASIVSLGIQTIPGIQFYVNDSLDTIIIGSNGIYELSLSDGYEIDELRFTSDSLELINSNPSAYLIIDIIYNVEE